MNVNRTKSFLELSAEIQITIAELKEQLMDESEFNDLLSPQFTVEQLQVRAKNEKIKMAIATLEEQLKQIGNRRGENIEKYDWFHEVPLEKISKRIFTCVYQEKMSYREVQELLGLPQSKIKRIYRDAFTIINNFLRNRALEEQKYKMLSN